MAGISVKLPLSLDDEDGAYKLTKNYAEMASQNLRTLILTVPGERMMDPNFGVGIRDFLFEQDSPVTKSSIRSNITKQAQTYLPYLRIVSIDIDASDETNAYYIKINYGLRGQLFSELITVEA